MSSTRFTSEQSTSKQSKSNSWYAGLLDLLSNLQWANIIAMIIAIIGIVAVFFGDVWYGIYINTLAIVFKMITWVTHDR